MRRGSIKKYDIMNSGDESKVFCKITRESSDAEFVIAGHIVPFRLRGSAIHTMKFEASSSAEMS